MLQSLIILGRQPAIGLAELESLFGAELVQPLGKHAATLSIPPEKIDFARLGGAIKLCKIVRSFKAQDWQKAQQLLQAEPAAFAGLPESGKLKVGLSAYNFPVSPQRVFAGGLALKKALRTRDRSVRLVPVNEGTALTSAQILHNRLTGNSGREFILIREGTTTICAYTIAEQDITTYTQRDRGRPKRDARVGMLPPKLAQTIINLASTRTLLEAITETPAGQEPACLLDPFCGTGVVLQEALLMGYSAQGTDLEPRMIDYTRANLTWLRSQYKVRGDIHLAVGDATTFQWPLPIHVVACETYLGQPFTTLPAPSKLEDVRKTCNIIIEKFLINLGAQIPSGIRLCLAVPAWQCAPGQFLHLPLLDHLSKLGYNRLDFKHAQTDDLIYYREGQIVARELLVLTKQ